MVEVVFGGKGGQRIQFDRNGEEMPEILSRIALQAGGPLTDQKALLPLARSLSASLAVSRQSAELVRPAAVQVSGAASPRAQERLSSAFSPLILRDPEANRPVGYTERIYVRFEPDAKPSEIKQILGKQERLRVVRKLPFARHAFILEPAEPLAVDVFDVALGLLERAVVSRCHPEILRPRQNRVFSPNQWHLGPRRIGGVDVDQHARVEEAWRIGRGAGINIAVIDDGFDVAHAELKPRLVLQFDASSGEGNAKPRRAWESHGTACAGVALASGSFGASGVAPEARLIAIRLVDALGSLAEADAFAFAARHGADVISCSWGPEDGNPDQPDDPRHQAQVPMSDLTRDALDHCFREGRGGRGCVVTWAAGNGNESVDNDGYAAHPDVMAVAACNDRGGRSHYSDFGRAISCAFPSSDRGGPSTGIWTTDRSGKAGYNPGNPAFGDSRGDYTSTFGGTSSACPGVAGTAALVLGVDPDLGHRDVRALIEETASKIDTAQGNYDARGRSPFYGFGRVDAAAAVARAAANAIA